MDGHKLFQDFDFDCLAAMQIANNLLHLIYPMLPPPSKCKD